MSHREQTKTNKPMILVADDDPVMLKLFSRVLRMNGYRVITASDSPTVLKLTAKMKRLQLVILELEATEQQSIQVCSRLREFSDVPVIILTAKHELPDLESGLQAGADDFIPKPVDMDEFWPRVKATLRRSGFLPYLQPACAT